MSYGSPHSSPNREKKGEMKMRPLQTSESSDTRQSTGSDSPEDKLLQALKDNNATPFLTILELNRDIDLNKVFKAPCESTRLERNPDLEGSSISNMSQKLEHIIKIATGSLSEKAKKTLWLLYLKMGRDNKCTDDKQYENCLDVLPKMENTVVNEVDGVEDTLLHVAARNGEEKIILKLLKHGADFTKENKRGERPLDLISNQTMNIFFDECIKVEKEEGKITYDYRCLVTDKVRTKKEKASNSKAEDEATSKLSQGEDNSQKATTETEVLKHLSKLRHHRELLKHPLVKSFLELKSQKCKHYDHLNIIYSFLFVIVLTFHCIHVWDVAKATGTTSEDSWPYTCAKCLLFILNSFFAIGEIFQLIVATVRYIRSPANGLEWLVIIITYALMFDDRIPSNMLTILVATCLLLSWIGLGFTFRNNDLFYIPISLFLKVSVNFLMLMVFYSFFIFGFIFSFYPIFEKQKPFDTLVKTGARTAVMMTGELDFSNISFDKHLQTSGIMFGMFLIFVTVILMNLMTAVAVEDARKFYHDEEIYYLKKEVDKIAYIESSYIYQKYLIDYDSDKWMKLVPRTVRRFTYKIFNQISLRNPIYANFVYRFPLVDYLRKRTLLFRSSPYLVETKLDDAEPHEPYIKTDTVNSLVLSKSVIKNTIRCNEERESGKSLYKKIDNLEKKLDSLQAAILSRMNNG